MMGTNGYTWFFKSSPYKVSLEEIKEQLEDKGGNKSEAWELTVKYFTNEMDQFTNSLKTSVFTLVDNLEDTNIAILRLRELKEYKDKKEAKEKKEYIEQPPKIYEFKDNIDPMLRSLELKIFETISIKGFSMQLSDLVYSFGIVHKDKGSSKEVFLRVELKSLEATSKLDIERYKEMASDVLYLLGPNLEKQFSSTDVFKKCLGYFESCNKEEKSFMKLIFNSTNLSSLLVSILINPQ